MHGHAHRAAMREPSLHRRRVGSAKVMWETDEMYRWYEGTIVCYSEAMEQHKILYSDGDSKWRACQTKLP